MSTKVIAGIVAGIATLLLTGCGAAPVPHPDAPNAPRVTKAVTTEPNTSSPTSRGSEVLEATCAGAGVLADVKPTIHSAVVSDLRDVAKAGAAEAKKALAAAMGKLRAKDKPGALGRSVLELDADARATARKCAAIANR